MNTQQLINKYFKTFDTQEELDTYNKQRPCYTYTVKDIKAIRTQIYTGELVKWIRNNEGKHFFLQYANLSNADLSFLYFEDTNFIYVDFRSANLQYSTFRSGDFRYADLSNVNFENYTSQYTVIDSEINKNNQTIDLDWWQKQGGMII
jgi:hypothetical protein